MSRKINGIPKEKLYKDTMRMVTEDNKAIRRAQKQSVDAFGALEVELGKGLANVKFNEWRLTQLKKQCNENADKLLDLDFKVIQLVMELKKQKQQNKEMRKWLEGYLIALFAIVVMFIIVVFVC